jgi:hypothetical protein
MTIATRRHPVLRSRDRRAPQALTIVAAVGCSVLVYDDLPIPRPRKHPARLSRAETRLLLPPVATASCVEANLARLAPGPRYRPQ